MQQGTVGPYPEPAYQPIAPLMPSAKSMQNRRRRTGGRSDAGDHAGADGRRVRAAVRHGRAVPGGVGEGAPGRGHAMPALWQPEELRLRPPRWLHALRMRWSITAGTVM